MSQGKSDKTYRKQRKKSQPGPLMIALGGALLLALALFAFLRGTSSTQAAPVEVKGTPSLKVNQDKVDLGNVKLGQPVTVNFDLTNVGDQPLKVEEQPYIEVVEGC